MYGMKQDNEPPPQTPEEQRAKLEIDRLRIKDALDGFSLHAVAQLVAEIEAEILKIEADARSRSSSADHSDPPEDETAGKDH